MFGVTNPIASLSPVLNRRAIEFRKNPSDSIDCSIRTSVSLGNFNSPFCHRDTVAGDTPAALATSLIVGRLDFAIKLSLFSLFDGQHYAAFPCLVNRLSKLISHSDLILSTGLLKRFTKAVY